MLRYKSAWFFLSFLEESLEFLSGPLRLAMILCYYKMYEFLNPFQFYLDQESLALFGNIRSRELKWRLLYEEKVTTLFL